MAVRTFLCRRGARRPVARFGVSVMQSPVLPEYSDESWMALCAAGRVRARDSSWSPILQLDGSEAEIGDVRRSV